MHDYENTNGLSHFKFTLDSDLAGCEGNFSLFVNTYVYRLVRQVEQFSVLHTYFIMNNMTNFLQCINMYIHGI